MVRVVVSGLAAVLCAAGLVAGLASPASAVMCSSDLPQQDINGDGHGDVITGAIGEPAEPETPGRAHVLYGTDDGLTAGNAANQLEDQLISQDAPGVVGSTEVIDEFGFAVATGDFNGDGCADAAFGVPGENDRSGAVNVLYGQPSGLVTAGNQLFIQRQTGPIPGSGTSERFGEALTTGDLDGDGLADLVVGAPVAVGASPDQGGAFYVLYGDADGLNNGATPVGRITQSTSGVPGTSESGDRFGASLATGDLTGDGLADVAAGIPGENRDAGSVAVVPGVDGQVLTGADSFLFTQNTAGVAGTAEAGDLFGNAVGAGDLTNDGNDDLVVGVPGENAARGAIAVLRGTAGGLSSAGDQFWSQGVAGVTGDPAPDEQFGHAVTVGDLGDGVAADVAVGVPQDSDGGAVQVFYGRPNGLNANAEQRWSQNTDGVQGTGEADDRFGFAVSVVSVRNSSIGDLVVGSPTETLQGVESAGAFHYFQTIEFGVTDLDQFWSAATPEVKGEPIEFGFFGFGLS